MSNVKHLTGRFTKLTNYTWDDFANIASRLDSTINFTLIRFLYSMMKPVLSNNEIILINVALLIFINVGFASDILLNIEVIVTVIFSLSSGLVAQALINTATNDELLVSMKLNDIGRLVEQFTVTTAMLLFASIIPLKLQQKEYVSRAITILLYMYTDATQNIVDQVDFGWSPPFFCVLISILLQRHEAYLKSRVTLQYIVKALNMVSINILITSVSTIETNATDLYTSTALLIITLFAIDTMMKLSGDMEEGRNYAIWKGAQQLFFVYQELQISTLVTFVLAVIFVLMHTSSVRVVEWLHLRNNTILELFLLVVVNVIIEQLETNALSVFSVEQAFVLMLYIISIHTFSLIFRHENNGEE
jgi:hypothetical protein